MVSRATNPRTLPNVTLRGTTILHPIVAIVFLLLSANAGAVSPTNSPQSGENSTQKSESSASAGKWVGTIQSIKDNTVTLTTDGSGVIEVLFVDSSRLVRTSPAHNDGKAVIAVRLSDLQIGDRMLVRGKLSDDGKTLTAVSSLVMKQSEVVQKQESEKRDWEKRGVGGLITAVDQPAGKVTISTMTPAGMSAVAVDISTGTIIRRYAPGSVKFSDARPGTLDEIKTGDQLRARGSRSPDGKEFAAEEIVSGSFRNIAGTITAIDPGENTIGLIDLAPKKPVVIKVTADSTLRKLPPRAAEMIAMRLKGGLPGAPGNQATSTKLPSGGDPSPALPPRGGPPRDGAPPEDFRRLRSEGAPDLQQILSRLPNAALSDLQKGDAVIVVATQAGAGSAPTVITLVSGVEAILSASPNLSGAASMLSPWNLSSSGGDSAAQ